MTISKETKIGFFGAVALTMLYFGFSFLKGTDFLTKTYTYYIVFDNIGALQPSNPVKLNGVKVGQVKSTEIIQGNGDKVLVALDVNKKILLRQGTKALLTSEILGGSTIMLQVPIEGKFITDGDTLITAKEPGIQELLQEKALPVLSSVDSLSKSLTKIVLQFDKTGYALNKMLGSADKMVGTADNTMGSVNGLVAQNQKSITMVLANLMQLSASLVETEKSLKPILINLQTTTDSLKALQLSKTLNNANSAIASLQKTLSTLENGEGTAGKLLKDETLYLNLNRTLISLNKLMTNFREYPKRYVSVSIFGKKDKGPAESAPDTTSK